MSALGAYWSEMRSQLMVAPTPEDMAIKLTLVGRAGESFDSPRDFAPYVSAGMSTGDQVDADLMSTFEENNERIAIPYRELVYHIRSRAGARYMMARRAYAGLPDDLLVSGREFHAAIGLKCNI